MEDLVRLQLRIEEHQSVIDNFMYDRTAWEEESDWGNWQLANESSTGHDNSRRAWSILRKEFGYGSESESAEEDFHGWMDEGIT